MLKTLALVLLVTVAACKSDQASAPATSGAAGEQGGAAGPGGGPKPRSAKIDLPQRPVAPAGAGAEAAKPGGEAGSDDPRRARRRERMAAIDTDGDGVISAEEREAAQ